MKAIKIILFVIAAGLLVFSFLFFLGAGDVTGGGTNWLITGGVMVVIAFVLIFFATRIKAPTQEITNVSVNIDLPGEVGMDTIKCKSCGGVLSKKDIKLVAGAPIVSCPYCGTSYQLTEEPKW
ncbi:MAG TPA: hypothetical protein G4N92_02910 [Anaerolineae bacterium]|nr:hypothetical protein [Anaerolineae bacterium]